MPNARCQSCHQRYNVLVPDPNLIIKLYCHQVPSVTKCAMLIYLLSLFQEQEQEQEGAMSNLMKEEKPTEVRKYLS
jgi:hypothetical protein